VIINISSCMSRQAAGFCPAYISAKGALDALTYELASLYGPAGIRVLAINPGAIDTEMSRDVAECEGDETNAELRQFSEEMIMLRRWGRPEEIAEFILAMTGSAGAYVTGTTLIADGGWHHEHLPHRIKSRLFPDDFK